ncbi:MAG: hypothetical protein LIP09_08870 [Bacteroidales bacterium]|nr:hypothetical protein [Bacteroidales bacterium]
MLGCREHFQVHADFCQQLLGGDSIYPRDLAQARDLLGERLHPALDLLVEVGNLFLYVHDARADGADHELVVFRELAFNCQRYLFPSAFEPPVGAEGGQLLRVRLSCYHCVDYHGAGLSPDVGENT